MEQDKTLSSLVRGVVNVPGATIEHGLLHVATEGLPTGGAVVNFAEGARGSRSRGSQRSSLSPSRASRSRESGRPSSGVRSNALTSALTKVASGDNLARSLVMKSSKRQGWFIWLLGSLVAW